MNDLSYDEKLRILQLRVEKKNWEVIAEETKHRKSKVIEVGKWLRSLNWGQVRALPVAIQRLRPDYIDYLEQENRQLKQHLRQSLPKVATGTVVLPANNTRIHHGLGQKPSVLLQLHEGQVVPLYQLVMSPQSTLKHKLLPAARSYRG